METIAHLHTPHDERGLDPHAPLARVICGRWYVSGFVAQARDELGERRTEAGLVGEHVPRDKRRFGRERLRALVDIEEGPDAVAGAVL